MPVIKNNETLRFCSRTNKYITAEMDYTNITVAKIEIETETGPLTVIKLDGGMPIKKQMKKIKKHFGKIKKQKREFGIVMPEISFPSFSIPKGFKTFSTNITKAIFNIAIFLFSFIIGVFITPIALAFGAIKEEECRVILGCITLLYAAGYFLPVFLIIAMFVSGVVSAGLVITNDMFLEIE